MFCRKAFTLLELAFVLIIIGIMLGFGVNIFSTLLKANKSKQSDLVLSKARDSLLGYVIVHGYFPCPDGDGDGHADVDPSGNCSCSWPNCFLPYLDLNTRGKDAYGRVIYYDVDNNFTKFSTIRGFCVHAAALVPSLKVTDGTQSYPVVAVVISAGQQDKDNNGSLLDGENYDGSPFAKETKTVSSNYDDLVKEVPLAFVYANVCDQDLKKLKIRIDGGYLCYNGTSYSSIYGYIYIGPGESVYENSCSGTQRTYEYLRDSVDTNLNGSVAWDGSSWSDI